jgi:hypothetical protein
MPASSTATSRTTKLPEVPRRGQDLSARQSRPFGVEWPTELARPHAVR